MTGSYHVKAVDATKHPNIGQSDTGMLGAVIFATDAATSMGVAMRITTPTGTTCDVQPGETQAGVQRKHDEGSPEG